MTCNLILIQKKESISKIDFQNCIHKKGIFKTITWYDFPSKIYLNQKKFLSP